MFKATFTNVSLFRSGKYNLLRCVYGQKSIHHVHLLRFAMHVIFFFFFVSSRNDIRHLMHFALHHKDNAILD